MTPVERRLEHERSKLPALTRSRACSAFKGRAGSALRPMYQILFCLLLAQALAGCGSGQSQDHVPPVIGTPPPSPSLDPWHGYRAGTVEIGGELLGAEALLTVDGLLRLYVNGPSHDWNDPEGSMQFVSRLEVDGDQASGTGVIFAQACGVPDTNRFCGETASGRISMSIARPGTSAVGHIEVTSNDGAEVWLLDMGFFGGLPPGAYYDLPADMGYVQGLYKEQLAEFAEQDDMIIDVSLAGELFFQSPRSGCTGNGTITPHLDGAFSVYDVNLTIENCTANNAYLNGGFQGLAVHAPTTPWDYSPGWLRMFLSSTEGMPTEAAVTMWASPE
ncbi:MAG: hypothetical protein ABFS02_09260 [Pseudomonadota bacterium]